MVGAAVLVVLVVGACVLVAVTGTVVVDCVDVVGGGAIVGGGGKYGPFLFRLQSVFCGTGYIFRAPMVTLIVSCTFTETVVCPLQIRSGRLVTVTAAGAGPAGADVTGAVVVGVLVVGAAVVVVVVVVGAAVGAAVGSGLAWFDDATG